MTTSPATPTPPTSPEPTAALQASPEPTTAPTVSPQTTAAQPTSPERTAPAAWPLLRLGASEFAPPFVVSLLLLPLIISGGTWWPWAPNMVDLEVYVAAVRDMVNGSSIYLTSTPVDNLKFIYPPIAAILMVVLLVGPYLMWQIVWTAAGTWALTTVLARCGVKRGILLGILAAALVVAMEPVRTTIGYGQVNTMLMALVVIDLLPDDPAAKRHWPRGVGIGLAASIKLTPLLFIVFAVLVGRRAIAAVAATTFAALTTVGFLVLPKESLQFWSSLGQGDVNTAGPIYVGNQAMSGVFARLVSNTASGVVPGMLVGFLVAGLATLAAAFWWRRGEKVFAVGLVGLGTCIASPLSWTHHHVWAVILLVAVITRTGLPSWIRVGGLAWMLWISVCLPLAVLPYGSQVEAGYTAVQQIVANAGPVLGSVFLVAVAVHAGLQWRSHPRVAVAPGRHVAS